MGAVISLRLIKFRYISYWRSEEQGGRTSSVFCDGGKLKIGTNDNNDTDDGEQFARNGNGSVELKF